MTKKISQAKNLIPADRIESKILYLRGQKVMIDFDLAVLYGVETKKFNQAVKRNLERFPDDFMFQLTKEEANLISQFATSSSVLRSQFVTSNNKNSEIKQIQGRNLRPQRWMVVAADVICLTLLPNRVWLCCPAS